MPEDRNVNKPPSNSEAERQRQAESDANKSTWQRLFVWVVVLVIFAVVFYAVLRHHDDTAAQPSRRLLGGTVTVTPATAQRGNIGVYLDAIGTVTPVYTATITAQVSGQIKAVHYQEGQLVTKGQPLIEIDPRPYEAQLMQAEGTLEKDTYVLEQAKMDLDRYRESWAKNGIPKQTLDDQEKIVLQDEGTVKNDQGTVEYDKVQVGFCHIIAPITGRVGLRLVDPGNVVQTNSTTPLVVVAQVQPTTVVFTVAEDYLPQVQEQVRQRKTLTVDAFDRAQMKKIATGKLLTFDNQIDTTTGTVKMRASFDNKNGLLFPNQFVNTRLLVKTLQDATLIPTSAIQHNGQASYVFLIQNDIATIHNIKAGVVDAGMTQVEGLNPGDVVANSSFEKLQDKAKVAIAKNPPASGANPNANSNASASQGPAK
jgi:membrane fusion protein, multidrug efflux system